MMKKALSCICIAAVITTVLCGSSYAAGSYLMLGSEGDDVLELQSLLADYGYFYAEPTGYFGEITQDALIAFQNDAGIEVDGIAGPQTFRSLGMDIDEDNSGDEASDTQDVEVINPFTRVLSIGDSGSDVTALQQLLKALGYFDESPTGFFGELTEAAVIAFQETNDLEVDGIVGDQTAGAMKGTVPSSSSQTTVRIADTDSYAGKVLDAISRTPATSAGYCATWVTKVMYNAGILDYDITDLRPDRYSYAVTAGMTDSDYSSSTGFNANDYWAYVCYSSDRDDLEPGMIVAVRNSFTYLGQQFGHVGIYIGDGQVVSSVGYLEYMDLDDFIAAYNNEELGSTVAWGFLPE